MSQPINFDRSLQRLQFIFHYCGLTFKSKKLTANQKLKLRCVYLFNFFCLNSDVLGGIYWFIDGIQTGKSFVQLTYISPCITFSFLANLKAIFLIHNENHVSDLIDDLRELERKDEIGNDNIENNEERVIKDNIRGKHVRFLHSVLKCSNVLSVLLILTFIVSPLILIALKYYQTKEVELILPFLVIYPFDSHDIRYWPFVYLHQFWSVNVVLLNICAVDDLLYVCCTYIAIQYRLLRYNIENVVGTNRVLQDHELAEFQQKCNQLIKWHQKLIRLASMLESIYAESNLFNFLSSSILICLTGFNVIEMENVAFAVSFLVFLSSSLLQIYMLCFFGDFLMASSMEVSDAVYNSKWYNLNARTRKNLLIVQTRF
ncbi:putative odorant receptor 92a isoform X2 [Bicyclus anynana]|uniref:Odorant receptor n=1 Tax=Bicyclus anynana TaxID=110368 RepID=A0ABM3LT58_BICAN|nr:putative odorant receptor 92a isoform X2 [Bicyclus anynana]